jgi:hypothetical protein
MAATAVSGCAGKRIEQGTFYSPKGYRITIPGAEWSIAEESRADLELRHRKAPIGMLVNADCNSAAPRRSLDALARNLFTGLRGRMVLEQGEVSLNGRPAERALVDLRSETGLPSMRVEAYVIKDQRCVYDLLYVAPVESFGIAREDFHRFVATLELSKKSE